jgi:NADP-reducing hydrogenase subunit HndB
MNKIRSVEELEALRTRLIEEKQQEARSGNIQVLVNLGTCGIAAGALAIMQTLEAQVETERLKGVRVVQTGCVGLCSLEPVVQVIVGEKPAVTYGKVTPETARRILNEHVIHGVIVQELVVEL